jgi:hypothetical protein
VSVPHGNRQETTTSQSSSSILPIHAEQQTSIANVTSIHSEASDTILSPGQSSADLMIAGVQELHGSTFDATVMQTDPSEGRNQLRSEKVSAYRNSTLDQRYLSEDPTNRHQTAQESLQDPSATGGHVGTPISMSSRLTTILATNYSGQSREQFRSNCHCKTLAQSGNLTLDHYYMLRSP